MKKDAYIFGEYQCKIDSKGRLMMPVKLRKELGDTLSAGLIMKRHHFTKCIAVYPIPEWDTINARLKKLSILNPEHGDFVRRFLVGTVRLEMDSAGRFLIPSLLMGWAGIDPKKEKEIIISGLGNSMEIWNSAKYKDLFEEDLESFKELSKKIDKETGGEINLLGLN